jgi:serine protease Do
MYELPKTDFSEIKIKVLKLLKTRIFFGLVVLALAVVILFFSGSSFLENNFNNQFKVFFKRFEATAPQKTAPTENIYTSDVSYEQAIINAVKSANNSVVSIVISKNLPVYEQQFINPFGDNNPFGDLMPNFDFQIPQYVQKGTKLQEVGAGSGFIVSKDGLVLTNKHVVSDKAAEYTVFTNDGQKYSAKVLALDPVQDLAVIKIQSIKSDFQPIALGDSARIQLGQTAIAIGNALGQFSNTVSVGIISGLQRTISASDQTGSVSEILENIIQTDAAINSGNSGGPLLNLKGEVIGINTAMAQGAEGIGFAIPINMAKKDISQVVATNKIVYPFLGVRYVLVDETVKEKYKLSVDYGALVLKGTKGEPAVTADSGAAKAGIKEKDVILSINGEKISTKNSMATIIRKYNVGDKISLHILRGEKEQDVEVTLGERAN